MSSINLDIKNVRRVIAISGQSGTGKGSTVKELERITSYQSFSAGNMMRSQARRLGLSMRELEESSANSPFMDFFLDEHIRRVSMEHFDRVIVEGRLVPYVVPNWAFKVQLTADDKIRFQRIAERDQLTIETAKVETCTREQIMATRFEKWYEAESYPSDLFDPKYVHLTINTENIDPIEVALSIWAAFKEYIDKPYGTRLNWQLPIFK